MESRFIEKPTNESDAITKKLSQEPLQTEDLPFDTGPQELPLANITMGISSGKGPQQQSPTMQVREKTLETRL